MAYTKTWLATLSLLFILSVLIKKRQYHIMSVGWFRDDISPGYSGLLKMTGMSIP